MNTEAYTPTIGSIIINTPSEKHAKRLAKLSNENLAVDADQYGNAVQLCFWEQLDPESFSLLWDKIKSFTSKQ